MHSAACATSRDQCLFVVWALSWIAGVGNIAFRHCPDVGFILHQQCRLTVLVWSQPLVSVALSRFHSPSSNVFLTLALCATASPDSSHNTSPSPYLFSLL
ncbi:hypothetical protein TRVL_10299 [Trypanosoma vivax]|nr:hypothetical protein TRVL_10299 [Trypanosoma vivax]